MLLYFGIGFNIGAVVTLLVLSNFNWARFKFLCGWFVYLIERGGQFENNKEK